MEHSAMGQSYCNPFFFTPSQHVLNRVWLNSRLMHRWWWERWKLDFWSFEMNKGKTYSRWHAAVWFNTATTAAWTTACVTWWRTTRSTAGWNNRRYCRTINWTTWIAHSLNFKFLKMLQAWQLEFYWDFSPFFFA